MRRLNLVIILLVLFIGMSSVLDATKRLARDANSIPIQISRYWTCEHDTIPAQAPTIKDSLAVPADCVEAVIIFQSQAGYIRPTATTSALAAKWMYVPVGVPVTVPVNNITYIVYRSYTGANAINIIWKKMLGAGWTT